MFGSIEFFEREIINSLNENQLTNVNEDSISVITSKLEYELLHDFICHERIRLECLNNLKRANQKIIERTELVLR